MTIAAADRKILIAIVVVTLFLLGAAVIFQGDDDVEGMTLSIRSSASSGARATVLFLGELGYPVEAWDQSPLHLPEDPAGVLLIIAQPQRPGSQEERDAVRRFLRNGGTLLTAGHLAQFFLPVDRARFNVLPTATWREYPPLEPSPLNRHGLPVSMPERWWWPDDPEVVAAYGREGQAVVVTYPYGRGSVVWLGSQVPLSNAGLKASGNPELLASILHSSGAKRVLWDVYFTQGGGGGAGLLSPAVLAAACQGLFIFGLVAWTHSRRFGPVRPLHAETRLSPLEFVSTLGSLYESAKATNISVDVAMRRFTFLAGKRLGLPPSAPLERLAAAIAAYLHIPETEVRSTLLECEHGRFDTELSAASAAALVQELHEYLRRLRLIPDVENT